MRVRHFAVSIALHALLFLSVIFNTPTNGGGNSQERQKGQHEGSKVDNKDVIEKQDGIGKYKYEELQVLLVDYGMLKKEKPKNATEDRDCPNPEKWYGGIGVTSAETARGLTVLKVHKGYPAYKAGLRAGDVIFSNNDNIRGEPGTVVILTVMRDNGVSTIEMIREKICQDK